MVGRNAEVRQQGASWRGRCALSLMLLVLPGRAQAHHLTGVAHIERAPGQAPIYREVRRVGEWEVTLAYTSVPEIRGCELAIGVKHVDTGTLLGTPLHVTLFDNAKGPRHGRIFSTIRGDTEAFQIDVANQPDGIYVARVMFDDGRQHYLQDFQLQVGRVWLHPLWAMIPIVILLPLVGINLIKRRRTGAYGPGHR